MTSDVANMRNPWLRRSALILTVAGIVLCLGPVYLVESIWRWIEREFECDLGAIWKGPK